MADGLSWKGIFETSARMAARVSGYERGCVVLRRGKTGSIWIYCLRYAGPFILDQWNGRKQYFYRWCVSVWLPLYYLLSACGVSNRQLCVDVPFFAGTDNRNPSCAARFFTALLQKPLCFLCSSIGVYTGKLFAAIDVSTVFCRSSTGIRDAFYPAVSIFCLSLFCGKKTGNTGKKDKIIVDMVPDIFCYEFWHDTCCPFL